MTLPQQEARDRFHLFMRNGQNKLALLTEYTKAMEKVQVRCRACNHEWGMVPNKLLTGRGCPMCKHDETRKRCKFSTQDMINKLGKYNIKLIGEYVNARTRTELECENGHRWIAATHSVVHGKTGCPSCAKYGFKKDKPAILYYILINKTHYKIGVTNNTVRSRYRGTDNKIIDILGAHHYDTGEEALVAEKRILTKYKEFKYVGRRLLKKAANTEIFTCPIEFCR